MNPWPEDPLALGQPAKVIPLLLGRRVDRVQVRDEHQAWVAGPWAPEELVISEIGMSRPNAFFEKPEFRKLRGNDLRIAENACAIPGETVDDDESSKEVEGLREMVLDYRP
ncbi:MAG TPA: hypothetical protein VFI76_00825 [Terrimicrobiaceae bacterium]|nr:hypothetical protein [Terrimicrobiaceae bacterium]